MAEMGIPTTASATTITTATTTTTALLLLRLLLETRRFPAFAFKVTNPQPLFSLSPSSPVPLTQSIPPFLHPLPSIPLLPSLCHLCTHVETHCCHRLIVLALMHTLGVDSKRKASATPRTPKLLSPPISSSCARFTDPSEA